MMLVEGRMLPALRLQANAVGQAEPASESISLPHVVRSDYDAVETVFGRMKNIWDVGDAFERFARPLAFTLECMKRVRPDVMEQPFDLVNRKGRLSVVDTKLGAEDCAWIEKVLNADGELGRLANEFNQQVVRSYDTDHGIRDAAGGLLSGQAFGENGKQLIDYAGLEESVDDSVKLMSLLHDVETTSLTGWRSKDHPYRMGGWLVQRYIEGEITEYVQGPDGIEAYRSRRGSLLREDLRV